MQGMELSVYLNFAACANNCEIICHGKNRGIHKQVGKRFVKQVVAQIQSDEMREGHCETLPLRVLWFKQLQESVWLVFHVLIITRSFLPVYLI